jgi:hypothetical protein
MFVEKVQQLVEMLERQELEVSCLILMGFCEFLIIRKFFRMIKIC